MGDPREPTDPRIIQALKDGVRERMGYPAAVGLPELREAVAAWAGRRFGVTLDPELHVIPTLGSKEAIFTFAPVVLDIEAGRDTVVVTEPGYPVPERGALFAGASVLELPLLETNAWLPDLDAVSAFDWKRAALVWVNYPNNPTGATAPLAFYERLAALARQHGFVVASDEAYTELWTDEPPVSALQLADWSNLVVFNTLSKRSSMTGFRSGFVAGDPALVEALKKFRPNVGTAPQEFVQRASVVAWSDEKHVARARESYARKRRLFAKLFARKGIRIAGGSATMYMWLAVPDGETSEAFAAQAARARRARLARLVPRPVGRGLRAHRARADRGGVRACRRDPRRDPLASTATADALSSAGRVRTCSACWSSSAPSPRRADGDTR